MISSPNSYFTAEEAKKIGAEPVFTFKVYPYYFTTALSAGSGIYVDCSFVPPNRIEVDFQAGAASWTSPEIVGNNETWPVDVTVTWTDNNTGYSLSVSYRTATTSIGLAAASWTVMTSGGNINLYQYYQWRAVWTGIRSFAFDVDSPLEPLAAYAVDVYDPEDEWQSYATDGESLIAYLESAVFSGEFIIPATDILDAGEVRLEAPEDFSDIVSGDHVLTLINPAADRSDCFREGRYSPGHSNFLFVDEDDWYLKNIQIYFGWKRPGTEVVDSILIYDGVILTWGPVNHKISRDGQLREHNVEIYSRNKISYLLDCQVGVPDPDGTPNPVIYGVNFAQADQVAGEMFGAPILTAYFESGGTSEFDHTYTDLGGTINVVTTEPATGDYCCQFTCDGNNSYAYGVLEFPASTDMVFFTCQIRFDSYPGTPNLTRFLKIDGGGLYDIFFYVRAGGRVHYSDGLAFEETDWYIDEYSGSWRSIALGIIDNDTIKLWVDGNEVFSKTGKAGSWDSVEIGPYAGANEAYTISVDDIEIWNEWYPEAYRIDGSPYTSIEAVYINGSLRVENAPGGVVSRIVAGRTPDADTIDLLPTYGVVRFTDSGNLPSGDVMIRAAKNTTIHPVDVIEEVVDLAGCGAYVDAASFAAAKADIPDDAIFVYADDTSAGDIIREICRSCLLLCWMDQDLIKLQAYLGVSPSSGIVSLAEDEIMEISETVDMEYLKTKIQSRWGWYDRNKKLFYECSDDSLGAKVGDLTEQFDLSWGATVVTESQIMAKTKADAYLARKSGGVSKLTLLGPLSWARLEIGDDVEIDVPFIRENEFYTIYSKTLRCQPPYGVELTVLKFLGE